MTTDVIKSIGLTGRNYATLQAFFDAIPADLVAADQRWIGEVYNDGEIVSTVKQIITGKTCDATRNIILRPATGQGFKDNANKLTNALYYNAAYGAGFKSSAQYDDAFAFNVHYMEVYNLQFNSTAIEAATTITSTSNNLKIQGNIIIGKSLVNVQSQGLNPTLISNVSVTTGRADCSGFALNYGTNGVVENNVILSTTSSTSVGIAVEVGSTVIKNNAIFGFATPIQQGTGSNNATNAATLNVSASGLTGLTFANEFVSATNLRLKSTSALVSAGVVISGLTTDIFGQTLASPPSIGAAQYLAPVADTTPPTMTGTMTSSGVSSSGYTLDWSSTTRSDNVAITGYQHSVDGTTWTDSGNVTSRSFTGKSASTLYPNYVRAYDAAGNFSTPALTLNVTTSAASGDVTAPNLAGSISQGAITASSSIISWPAATDNVGVDHYEVSKDSGSTWTSVSVGTLTYTFTGLAASTTYGQRVRALDLAGNISQVLSLSVTTSAASSTVSFAATGQLKNLNGSVLPDGIYSVILRSKTSLATAPVAVKTGLAMVGGVIPTFTVSGPVSGTEYVYEPVSEVDTTIRGLARATAS